ncbi:hypothetical protein CEP51_006786 [Fusarium floridanum]|uniref:Uncharacterized protein n=1 Tax=Fusarium floridanum TaxID=1325733 RepID=A0A428RRP8_9HYPO|nr:hypothetical protein CEP51_006786 [Fusarium floridanum]
MQCSSLRGHNPGIINAGVAGDEERERDLDGNNLFLGTGSALSTLDREYEANDSLVRKPKGSPGSLVGYEWGRN